MNIAVGFFKHIAYYWKRWRIDREFKSKFNSVARGTFIQSIFDHKGALSSASSQYGRLAGIRFKKHVALNAEYQMYFNSPLTIKGASEIV